MAFNIVTVLLNKGQQIFLLLNKIFQQKFYFFACTKRDVFVIFWFAIASGSCFAGVAQLIEQLICNHQVAGLSPITGFYKFNKYS